MLAKIASELNKPDGLYEITADNAIAILDPLPVGTLGGIGPKTRGPLEAAGIRTLRDLRLSDDAALVPHFGRHTRRMRERASGIDDRPVVAEWSEQQVSAETTFDQDLLERDSMRRALANLGDRVTERLRAKQRVGACITIKVRRHDFLTFTRSRSFHPPTDRSAAVVTVAQELLDEWLREHPGARLRLLGIGLSALAPSTQLDLFAAGTSTGGDGTGRGIDPALDEIRARFGRAAVTRASNLNAPTRSPPGTPRRSR